MCFCHRDEEIWPNLNEEFEMDFFENILMQLKELDRLTFLVLVNHMHSQINEIIKIKTSKS